MLVDGSPVPHDILRILGMQAFTSYMVNEVQKVYRMQGVKIDDKHIEVILNMMLKRVEVTHSGETTLLTGEYVDRDVFEETNQKMIANKMKPASHLRFFLVLPRLHCRLSHLFRQHHSKKLLAF